MSVWELFYGINVLNCMIDGPISMITFGFVCFECICRF